MPIRWIHIELGVCPGVQPKEKMLPEEVFELVDITPRLVTNPRYRDLLGLYKMIEQSARKTPGIVSFVMFGVECEGVFRTPNIMIGEGAGDSEPTDRDFHTLLATALEYGPDALVEMDEDEARAKGLQML